MSDLLFEKMLEKIEARYPNYAEVWKSSRNEFGEQWLNEFEIAISKLFGHSDEKLGEAIDGYAEFCTDALRSQIYFERKGRYKASSYDEVAKQCYHNSDFMFRKYLPGMFLSHFVWPHHHRMLQYFRKVMPGLAGIGRFAEVGTGCGMYSKEALALFPGTRGTGYDISEHSLAFTSRVVGAFGFAERYETRVLDILAHPPDPVDLVICQEVLEHLEAPADFVRGLHAMTARGGYAYISAAINAGHVDHIYLYRTPGEVAKHIVDAGFTILDEKAEFAYAGKPIEITPCHGSFVCRRTV